MTDAELNLLIEKERKYGFDDTAAALTSLRDKNARLREALGWFLNDTRFQVGVGGNPIAVEDMLRRARAALGEG